MKIINKYNSLLPLLLALLLSLSQCRCKDEKKPCQDPTNINCENYDPCYGKIVTADFTIRQWNGWYIDPKAMQPEDCDTILLHGIRLHPKINVPTNVFWKIGTDDRIFTEGELKMLFSEYINNPGNIDPNNPNYYKPIPITLTVKTPGWQKCVAPKDTVLQHTRNLVFVSAKRPNPILGKFVGISDFDNKEREIEIVQYSIDSIVSPYSARTAFINFPNLDNKDSIILRAYPTLILKSFKYLWTDGGYTYVYDNMTNTEPYDGLNMFKIRTDHVEGEQDYIKIEYRYVTKQNQYKKYTFSGRRKN